jgi:hypothetical protein
MSPTRAINERSILEGTNVGSVSTRRINTILTTKLKALMYRFIMDLSSLAETEPSK